MIEPNYEPKTLVLASFILGSQMVLSSLASMNSYSNKDPNSTKSNRDSNYLFFLSAMIFGIVLIAFSVLIFIKPTLVSDLGPKIGDGFGANSWLMWVLILLLGLSAIVMAICNTVVSANTTRSQQNNNTGYQNLNVVWVISYAMTFIPLGLVLVSEISTPGSLGAF